MFGPAARSLAMQGSIAVWGSRSTSRAMREDEISALFERYAPLVLRRARAILGDPDEAKDIAQDVFVKAFLERKTFEGRSEISTWLYRITTNLCLNRIRDTKRRRALAAARFGQDRSSVSPDMERILTLQAVLRDAEEQEAMAAIYVYLDGMSHREAAEMLGVAKRTVGNLLERFQRAAEKQLAQAEPLGAAEGKSDG